jgi:glutathione S-transferase
VRADLAALPALLDRVDRMLGDGTLTLEPPNAATLQIMATVRVLGGFADLADLVASHACAAPAQTIFPHYRAQLPAFLAPEWLEEIPNPTARENPRKVSETPTRT